ncbi:unnamed protein product [Ophioblennius macclurei]
MAELQRRPKFSVSSHFKGSQTSLHVSRSQLC